MVILLVFGMATDSESQVILTQMLALIMTLMLDADADLDMD